MDTTRSDRAVRPRRPPEGTAFAARVEAVLEQLVARSVTLRLLLPGTVQRDPDAAGILIARYTCDDGAPDRLLVADLPTMAWLGGARAMLSHGAAVSALEAEDWPDALLDNCFDVLQRIGEIWSRDGRTVGLSAVHGFLDFLDTDPPTDDLAAILAAPSRRLEAEITVAGYGTGRMALLRA